MKADFDTVLDDIQSEIRKLDQLLEERETGLVSWWSFLSQKLDKIQQLIERLK